MSYASDRADDARDDRAHTVASWRAFSARVEARLAEVGVAEGDQLVAAMKTLLERWLEGTATVSEATQLLLAGRQIAAEYGIHEDTRRRREMARHEAGHAVAAWFLGSWLERVTILHDVAEGIGGSVTRGRTRGEVHAVISLAGRAAQEIAGDPYPGRGADADEVSAREAVFASRDGGMGQREADALLYYCRIRAAELVRRLWPAVQALSDALIHRLDIPGPEAEAIIAAAVPTTRPCTEQLAAVAA